MGVRGFRALLVACLLAGALWAANDPFVGKWKLDPGKSKLTGEKITVKALGGNKYSITFPGNVTDTLIANGTPQRVHLAYVVSLTPIGTRVWKFVVKQNGHLITSADTWTLSSDGKTMLIEAVVTRPDGSTGHVRESFTRTAGTSGFAGTWRSARLTGVAREEVIRPYDRGGLTFDFPAWRDVLNLKFDGRDYPETGPDVPPGSAVSARRVDERTIDETDKVKGKVLETVQLRVSEDGKTLTETEHNVGQASPVIAVYDRE